MIKNPMKKPINEIIFFCGFETETTIKLADRTIYTLVDIPSNTKIKLTLWQPEGFNDEYALSIEHEGLENLSKTGVRRWERVLTKLNSIEGLIVSVEDLREATLTTEQEQIIDDMLIENSISLEDTGNDK
mgnify:CR=1 FL=1